VVSNDASTDRRFSIGGAPAGHAMESAEASGQAITEPYATPRQITVRPGETATLVYRFVVAGDVPYAWTPVHGDGEAGRIRVSSE
jgi:hypothetical protein